MIKLLKRTFVFLYIFTNFICSQDSVFVYPSMNDLCVEFNSEVEFSDSLIKYNYNVKSLSCSKQPIWQVRVEVKEGSIAIDSPSNWYVSKLDSMEYLKNRIITVWSSNDSTSDIYANEELSGFIVLSLSLPVISKFYLTGYVPMPVFPIGEEPERVINNDVFENSYNDFTIAPGNNKIFEQAPFYFLKNYIDSSFAFGWIKEESVLTKYNNYLTTAKNYLIEGDSTSARSELQLVINDCIADSSTVLTSEAFALLYFNTEYLISQLSERRNLPIPKCKTKR